MPSRYWYHFSSIVPVAMQDIPFPPVLLVLLFLLVADCGLQSRVILVSFSTPGFFQRQRGKATCNASLHQREQQVPNAAKRKCSCKCFRE